MKRYIKYLIYTDAEHKWYVREYLIPHMVKQGILKRTIEIWTGSFIDRCKWIAETQEPEESIWHLEWDIVIGDHFKEITDREYPGFVAGCCDKSDGGKVNCIGNTSVKGLWMPTECVLIPNAVAIAYADHDGAFKDFILEYNIPARNLMPNIVENIGQMIDKSMIQRSAYWRSDDLNEAVEELRTWLMNREE